MLSLSRQVDGPGNRCSLTHSLISSASVALAAAALAGCGGGGGAPAPDSPKQAVAAFIGAVGHGDWKAACDRLGDDGAATLGTELAVGQHDVIGPAEQDQFGSLKDCPATLQKHAAGLRAVISGATPGAVQQRPAAKQASVSSPRPCSPPRRGPGPADPVADSGLPPLRVTGGPAGSTLSAVQAAAQNRRCERERPGKSRPFPSDSAKGLTT